MSTAEKAPSWAGDPPLNDAARTRLLAATSRCVANNGLRAVSVAGIAAEAGVSRPTVYRYFADRNQLIEEALTSAADELRAEVVARIENLDSAEAMLVEAVVLALNRIPTDPVLKAVWDSSAADSTVIELFTMPSGVAWARACLHPAAKAANWTDAQADEAMEVLLRLVLSFLVSPAPRRSDEEMRSFLHRRLIPSLDLPSNQT